MRGMEGGALLAGLMLCSAVFAAESSRLSRAPIPLQTEAHALISVGDIADYAAFAGKLRDGADDSNTPAGRVWELLNPELRDALSELPADAELKEKLKYRLVNALNDVLRRRDFYDAEAWKNVELPEALRAQMETGLDELSPIDATYQNRQLLRASFPDDVLESRTQKFPKRPRTLRLFGDDFLNTGNLQDGYTLPTGAVWQPSFFAHGTFRSAWQYSDTGTRSGKGSTHEWANRLDVFFNLALTPTERIVVGFRPIDQNGDFSGYTGTSRDPGFEDEWHLDGDGNIEQLFFEGDFGELFPKFDPEDSRGLDFGFAVGRQPIFLQEGIMLNDNIDAFGIVRNNIPFPGTSNLRITGIWAWDDIDRGIGPRSDTRPDSPHLFGILTAADFPKSTVEFDLTYRVDDDRFVAVAPGIVRHEGGDQFNGGLSIIRRIGPVNTSFRVNQSLAGGEETDHSSDGTLLFVEASWTPPHGYNLVYGSAFWAIDKYRSAARDPSAGGPLGRAGILFSSPGIGTHPAAIPSDATRSVGGAFGYQMFFNGTRRQLIFEVGFKHETDDGDDTYVGAMARYQHAFTNRMLWAAEGFAVEADDLDARYGLRTELTVRF